MTPPLRIGTRGSPLALAQAHDVEARLKDHHPGLAVEGTLRIEVIRTTGDRIRDRPLAEIGGKGLFCKEIEQALLDGEIDLAVHSAKDLPTWLPDRLTIAAALPRADPRDVLIARDGAHSLDDLAAGARIGTCSMRRAAQLLARRPDLVIEDLRGNVGTRLGKVEDGTIAATFLAAAGLIRLGMDPLPGTALDPSAMLPASGQGVIALECRADDEATLNRLRPLDDPLAHVALLAERAFLDALEGSCRTPIGGYAVVENGGVWLRGLIARPDGTGLERTERKGSSKDAAHLGRDAGLELRARVGAGYFD